MWWYECEIEGAVHVVTDLFEDNHSLPNGWGVLLVDASNKFVSIMQHYYEMLGFCGHAVPISFLIHIVVGHL